ncbi:thiamine phosphate synthase [Deinococcus cellulosilyticus]|uniref:Thiamine-phosphate synthase n=1 Tax=Deinococcus cellulosilyticus (strain DSM 18568 / NBRC 106333 / KACC 11606 / 5516J-15) TaxID=1223518 RepID=A0A511N6I8_DEIC1|nr:thiamine phosphate synthase [Deinococcus cellulosilyticus]GEM48077.1 thiamine-phosphate synthase [Deinococcus cellulosilyticus NBRC 106333 = KACC 11606]
MTHKPNPNLYLVANFTPEMSEKEYLERCEAALKGGVGVLQLRAKQSEVRSQIALGEQLRDLTRKYRATFFVNDRVDVALTVRADGVHLGQQDLPPAFARQFAPGLLIGRSTHAPEQALHAVKEGAHYFAVGPIWETPTKAGRKAVGLEYARWAVQQKIPLPFYAIGNVNLDNITELVMAGVQRVAVVRALLNAPDPEQAARGFCKSLELVHAG